MYLKMAYHLSQEARDGLITYGLPADLRATLLEHQAVAAQFAAGALDRLGGVMIGDVVGLGKTLVAVAVAPGCARTLTAAACSSCAPRTSNPCGRATATPTTSATR